MNEFAIEWTKDRDYAGVTAPSGTALKSKLLSDIEKSPRTCRGLCFWQGFGQSS